MTRLLTFPECWSDDRRMKVLFSPLRQRNVNPENYDGQIRFWTTLITSYAKEQGNPRINLSELRNAFVRNGEKPHCLQEVLSAMVAAGELKPLDQFLQGIESTSWTRWLRKPLEIGAKMIRDTLFNTSSQSAPEVSYVLLDVVNCQADAILKSLKNQIVTKADVKKRISEWNIAEDALPLVLYELQCRQKLITQQLHDEELTGGGDVDEKTVLKFGTETHKAFELTEIEFSIHKLEFTEKHLLHLVGRLEEQVHEHEQAAKRLLHEKKRVLAKNSLRKRDATGKRLEKRVQCLENVQTLLQRIHEVTDDAQVLDAYRTGTKSLQLALSKSGITLDTVDEAINQMQDVIELHDEVKSAIAGGVAVAEDDAELERELAELVAGEGEKLVTEGEDNLMKQLESLTIATEPLPLSSPEKVVKGEEEKQQEERKEEPVCV